jgi:hypothetical protein
MPIIGGDDFFGQPTTFGHHSVAKKKRCRRFTLPPYQSKIAAFSHNAFLPTKSYWTASAEHSDDDAFGRPGTFTKQCASVKTHSGAVKLQVSSGCRSERPSGTNPLCPPMDLPIQNV